MGAVNLSTLGPLILAVASALVGVAVVQRAIDFVLDAIFPARRKVWTRDMWDSMTPEERSTLKVGSLRQLNARYKMD
jgi:hypothetical protein